jgi:sulfur-carrier protein adenylyltransferase/sulfurtransferase
VSKSYLEQQIEAAVPDRSTPVILYCAGGVRSLFAAQTLADMGYSDVASMSGGFQAWKSNGLDWTTPPKLTEQQKQRYSRHLLIPEVGTEGQARLLGSKALLIGAGGLGSPAALYLAAAGVGTLGIIDFDVVDLSNLQRQVLHTNDRIGEKKVESARKTLTALNPDVTVVGHEEMLVAENVDRIIAGYDVILDGTDTFETRYILNDAAVAASIPVVHASVFRFEGQLTTFIPYEGPCYRCLYPTPPPPELAPGCSVAGVLGVVPGIMGLLQANEVLKVLLGIGETLAGRLLLFDALETEFTELKLRRDPKCPVCCDEAKAAREAGTPIPVSTFGEGVFTLNAGGASGAEAVAMPLTATPLGGAR